MSAIENLESLTNAEIRLKCIQYGLPNVPVTDSSRKLLVKRLRDAMISKDNTTTETTTKSNRRETINVAKANKEIAADNASEPITLSQSSTKNRRTIAATVSKDDTVPTSIPVSTRRRSVQKDVEPKPKKSSTTKAMPVIIIEDEEDSDLVTALENAEKESTTSVPIETISSRRKSRSVSVPKVITEVISTKKRAMTPLAEENIVEIPKDIPTVSLTNNNNAASQKSYQPIISSMATSFTQPTPKTPVDLSGNWYGVYDKQDKISMSQSIPKLGYENPRSRYSVQNSATTVYSSPSMRYSVGGGDGDHVGISSYRSKYTAADLLNEQSDTDIDGGPKSPFLSNFARTLERSKSIGRDNGGGRSSSHYKRNSGNYDSIRGRRAQNEVTFGQLVQSVNHRYKLKNIIFVLAFVSMSIFVYVWLRSS